MVAVWRSIAYRYAGLEDEVEICIMSFCSAVVKSGYPLESAHVGWPRGMKPAMLLSYHRISGYDSIGISMLDAAIGLIS